MKNKRAKWYNIYYFVVIIMLLCGFIFLLSSCMKDPDESSGEYKGNKVTIKFSLNTGGYEDEVIETRSLNAESETDLVHMKGDIYLSATLEEDFSVTTRAITDNLLDGTLVRIIAYTTSTPASIHDSSTYIVTGGGLMPIIRDITVVDGYTYQFVAYSLNTLSLPAIGTGTGGMIYVSINGISTYSNPDLDLLWGKTQQTIPLGSPSNTVNIELQHKFSRVRVVASSQTVVGANIHKIENAHVNPSYGGTSGMTLDLISGTFGNLTSGTFNLLSTPDNPGMALTRWREKGTATTWISGSDLYTLNTNNVESDHFHIFTNHYDTTALKISNLNVGNIDLGTYQFRFSGTGLKPGHSYTLDLKFKRLIWAGSNIYWNGYYLTFLDEYTPVAQQGYQGVYFYWGSLVGISPTGGFTTNTPIYVPPISRPNWSIQYYASGPGNIGPNDWNGNNMANVPQTQTGTLVSQTWLDDHRTRNYLADEIHTPTNVQNFRGDICKYLSEYNFSPSGNWRMPNDREFGTNASIEYMNASAMAPRPDVSLVFNNGTTDFYAANAYYIKAATNTISPATIFPNGGSRLLGGGINTSSSAYYMSGSPSSNSAFYTLYLTETSKSHSALPIGYNYQALVRCVKLDGTAAISMSEILPSVAIDGPAPDGWKAGGIYGLGTTEGQGDLWY